MSALPGGGHIPGAISQKFDNDEIAWKMTPVNGRGFLYHIDEQTYFSPNCHRMGLVAPPVVHNQRDGVLHGRDYNISPFKQPQWWTKAHAYLAFVPLHPDISVPPLNPLLQMPRIEYDAKSGAVPEETVWQSWRQLQARIAHATQLLIYTSGAAAVRPAYPCARVDNQVYKGVGRKVDLRHDIINARSWFSAWFGCLSYAIAVSEAMSREADRKALYKHAPNWMMTLLKDFHRKLETVAGSSGTADRMDHLNSQSQLVEIDDRFVSDLAASCIGCFDPGAVERAGVFVAIPDNLQTEMVSIDWLCEFHVPVWYPWGEREEGIARENTFWRRYAPPADAIRIDESPPLSNYRLSDPPHGPVIEGMADNFRTTRSPLSLAPTPRNNMVFRRRPEPEPPQKTWEAWFESRRIIQGEISEMETPRKKSQRENRQRNPPTRWEKTKFYVWVEDPSSRIFYRRRAFKEEIEDLFEAEGKYGRSQARYDPYYNEWDLCEFFGPPDESQIRHLAETQADFLGTTFEWELLRWRVYYGVLPELANLEAGTASVGGGDFDAWQHIYQMGSAPDVASPELAEDSSNDQMDPSFNESTPPLADSNMSGAGTLVDISPPEELAYQFFGYTPAKNHWHAFQVGSDKQPVGYTPKALGIMTLVPAPDAFWNTNQGQALIKFMAAVSDSCPSGETWDLLNDNPVSVTSLPRFKVLRRALVPAKTHVRNWNNVTGSSSSIKITNVETFWFASDHGQRWLLGCSSAAVALFICRLNSKMTPVSIAFHLVGQGVRFHTWHMLAASDPSLDSQIVPKLPRHSLVSYRHHLYHYTSEDFDSYLLTRRSILKGRRGRAALLRGGIIWRLAIEDVSIHDVLAGPTSIHEAQGSVLIRGNGHGGFMLDDDLEPDELDAICGHYDSFNVDEGQMSRCSWWPPVDLWERYYGFSGWSSDAESDYQKWLAEIHKDYRPLPRSVWRKRLRGSSQFNRLLKVIEDKSLETATY